MPSMPASRKASLTDSNREGWMMASSFIMKSFAPAMESLEAALSPTSRWLQRRCLYGHTAPAKSSRFVAGASRFCNGDETFALRLEVVGLFAVLRDVQTLDLLLFADPDPGDRVGDLEQHDGADDRKGPGDQNANELIGNLAPVTIEATDRLTHAKDRVDDLLRENTGEQRADGAACTMDPESIERIVVAEHGFGLGDHPVAKQAGDETDAERRHWADKTGSRRDRDKSRDSARDRTQGAGVPVLDPLCDAPTESGGGRGEVGGDERAGGEAIRSEGAAGVEPEPADPEEAGANKAEDQAVRRHRLLGEAGSFAKIQGTDQCGDTRTDVNDCSASEVQCREFAPERGVE